MGVYLTQPRKGIAHTRKLIQWYRDFIRSEAELARIPGNEWMKTANREEAQRILTDMIDNAINLKAKVPVRGNTVRAAGFIRDQQRLHARINQRVRVYQFETKQVRSRFSHLLSSREDI